MNPRTKKRLLWGAGGVLAFFLLLIALLIIFRARVLDYTIEQIVEKVENRYPGDFNVGKAEFVDLNSVVLSDLYFVPDNRDTLFTTDSVYAAISVRSIFKGRIVFKRLDVANAYLTARKNGDQDNFSFLFRKNAQTPSDTTRTSRNYGELLNRLIETAFDNVPDQVDFRNLNVSFKSRTRTIDMKMPYLTIEDGEIDSRMSVLTDSLLNNMRVHGTIDPRKYRIAGSLYATDKQGIRLPYIEEKFNGTVAFDTLHLSLTDKQFRRERLTIKGRARAKNLVLHHAKIADEDVLVKDSAVDYALTIGPNYYSVDEETVVRINKAVANLHAVYQNPPSEAPSQKAKTTKKTAAAGKDEESREPDVTRIYDLKVQTKAIPANDFFESLPAGLFENLEGIRAEGTLQYKLNFHVNMDSIDRVKFDSDLDASKDFKIVEYGNTNLEKIKGQFEHTVYEYGKPVRTFMVGPSNPFYSPISQISPLLRDAILTAEDAGFYRHNGFHEEAFRQAIAANLKKNDFVRGGSTISMQLVKNVFLTRKKTVARKVEEAIIVWLIENQDLVSKNRMFEVYLNIIEWGPNVYGAKDASRFYFGKQPSELTLAEAIFLTSIIPSPKKYRSSFDSYGNLRSWKGGYFRLIAGIMLRRGKITQEEYDNLTPNVQLYGRARDLIVTEKLPEGEEEEEEPEYELKPIDMLGF
ncbi:biosynthetic peptidoglycan transglycosylase [Botryobacter ruber]|uniref:biosynthetic peptidoglycan transglycosylase n=1 Tax=Botryobacter ruber TaxID=2171629 RepID=UPI000E0AAFEF|nr:biosynthetic peptidoglycan transglycosylase [Botryobacter ruber]